MSSVHAADLPDPTWPETWPRTADEIHVFDIQGDVLLKLVRHPEADDSSECSSVGGDGKPQVEEVFDEAPGTNVELPDSKPSTPPTDERPGTAAQEPDENALRDDVSVHSDDSASSVDILTDVHMRVSSKHLILASPTFRSMLGPNFEEGQRLRIEGSTDIALGDDDPDAFEILLNIIHGLTRRVPRSVSLDMLTKLAVLVNYYQMHEAVELFSDTWIDTLVKEGLPQSYGPEAVCWLLITWVFHKPVEFRSVSRVIELGCDENLEDDFDEGLPIPPPIISVMLAHRAAAIEGAMIVVHNLIARYSSPELLCPVVWDENNKLACDALLLGSLIKGSASIGIWPKLSAPYQGFVFKDLAIQIRELKVFDVCNHMNGLGRYQSCSDAHGVKTSIEASMNALEAALYGLNLEDFCPQDETRWTTISRVPIGRKRNAAWRPRSRTSRGLFFHPDLQRSRVVPLPLSPPFLHMSEQRVMFRCKPSIGVFLTHAHAAMQHVCSFASLVDLTSSRDRISDWIGGNRRRERERKRQSRWHDEMAHRPSGECGERNLPCDSAVSPITALAS